MVKKPGGISGVDSFCLLRQVPMEDGKMTIKKTVVSSVFVLLMLFVTGGSLYAAECSTVCKDGPPEYRGWSTWTCDFSTGETRNLSVYAEPNPAKFSCALRKKGRFKNIDVSYGRYLNSKECLEDFCVPALIKICGVEDRCAELKNWIK